VPVFVTNDCRASMLGIYVTELKSKPRNVLGVFIGTGIGGGLILNGESYSGFNNTAGEIGHMVVDVNGPKCGCGNKGCIEAIASRTAIFRQIKTGVEKGEKTILTEMLGGNLDEMKSGDLRKALRRGDKFVRGIIDEAALNIGVATANLINVFSPEVVVFGGGVIEALADEMMEIIVKTARDHALPGTMKDVQLIASKLGDNAAITGGAVLARREAKQSP
jgi:glucokinase